MPDSHRDLLCLRVAMTSQPVLPVSQARHRGPYTVDDTVPMGCKPSARRLWTCLARSESDALATNHAPLAVHTVLFTVLRDSLKVGHYVLCDTRRVEQHKGSPVILSGSAIWWADPRGPEAAATAAAERAVAVAAFKQAAKSAKSVELTAMPSFDGIPQ